MSNPTKVANGVRKIEDAPPLPVVVPPSVDDKNQKFAKALQELQDQFQIDMIAVPRLVPSTAGTFVMAAVITVQPRQPQPVT